MRVTKHEKPITCPWCNAGATMTLADARGEFCMACKRHLHTGEALHAPPAKSPDDPQTTE